MAEGRRYTLNTFRAHRVARSSVKQPSSRVLNKSRVNSLPSLILYEHETRFIRLRTWVDPSPGMLVYLAFFRMIENNSANWLVNFVQNKGQWIILQSNQRLF